MESRNVPGEEAGRDSIRVLIAGPDPMVMYIVGRCVQRNGGFVCAGRAFTCEEMKDELRRASFDIVLMEPAMSRRGDLESVRIVQRFSDSMMIVLSRVADIAAEWGISRTTAWRYLEYLAACGFLCRTVSFRSVGRPAQLYRLL